MLKIIYRICDLRNGNTKIPGISKRQCFLNFVEVFGVDNLTIIADHTCQETVDFIRKYIQDIEITTLGNSGSFIHALDMALRCEDEQSVYFVEDDYLHHDKAPAFLHEGLERADYVNLYDHADKYMSKGPNPLVSDGGENTKVILTASSHWKYTNSTTMTFAARVKTLRADQDIFRHYCNGAIPLDYHIFRHLAERGRTLITPIPGRSTHCDEYPSPFIFDRPIPLGSTPDVDGIRAFSNSKDNYISQTEMG